MMRKHSQAVRKIALDPRFQEVMKYFLLQKGMSKEEVLRRVKAVQNPVEDDPWDSGKQLCDAVADWLSIMESQK